MQGIAFRARGKCPILATIVLDGDGVCRTATVLTTAEGSHFSDTSTQWRDHRAEKEIAKVEPLDPTISQWAS